MSLPGDDAISYVLDHVDSPPDVRVQVYNRVSEALRSLVRNIADDPVLGVQLVPAAEVVPNDYNPNRVAGPELDLLEQSILADGITMPVVTVRDEPGQRWVVVDGFHRRTVVVDRLKRRWVPISIIDKALADRMASTVRHNRARGKHTVDLMGALVVKLTGEGWGDGQIAERLGMSVEELLRLRQMMGAARALAATEYTRSAGVAGDTTSTTSEAEDAG